jgi:hypothetical protein
MRLECFGKKWRIRNNPSVVDHDIVSLHFRCDSSTVIIGWSTPIQWITIIGSDSLRR